MEEHAKKRHIYNHDPLPGPSWTRIIHLEEGKFDDPIRCVIELIDLDDPSHPPYVALSYRWGDPDDITTIEVSCEPVSITRKLHDAIRRLRRNDELNISRATEVVVDLGDSDKHTGAALHLMHQLGELPHDMFEQKMLLEPNFQQYGLPSLHDPAWNAWMELRSRPWFNRVWMVQEMALARDLKMMVGEYVIDGTAMEFAHQRSANLQLPTTSLIEGVLSSERNLKGFPVMILVKQMYKFKQTLRLADLFGLSTGYLSTDERDHIYALRGLVKNDYPAKGEPAIEDELKVDYNEKTERLAMRFARYLARRRPSSLIWMFAGGPHSSQPSWAPKLESSQLRMPTEGLYPSFEDHMCVYKAAGDTHAQYDFDGSYLKTKGCFVDTIRATSRTFDMGLNNPNRSAIAMGEEFIAFEHEARQMFVAHGFPAPFDEASGDCSDLYWRTLISDGDEYGRNRTPASLVESFKAFATMSNMVKDGRTQGDIDHDPQQIMLVMRAAPYLSALAQSMLGRKVCVTESGRVGNVTAGTEIGDQLVVVLGVEKPLIMRNVGVEGDLQYIGIAHVQGIMDGELLEGDSWNVENIRVV